MGAGNRLPLVAFAVVAGRLRRHWGCAMSVGMQIAYRGFVGSAGVEAKAHAELARLARFSGRIAGCHLAIEAMWDRPGHRLYDARLDLITPDHELIPLARSTDEDPDTAVHVAFDTAVRLLEKDNGQG